MSIHSVKLQICLNVSIIITQLLGLIVIALNDLPLSYDPGLDNRNRLPFSKDHPSMRVLRRLIPRVCSDRSPIAANSGTL